MGKIDQILDIYTDILNDTNIFGKIFLIPLLIFIAPGIFIVMCFYKD